MKLAKGL